MTPFIKLSLSNVSVQTPSLSWHSNLPKCKGSKLTEFLIVFRLLARTLSLQSFLTHEPHFIITNLPQPTDGGKKKPRFSRTIINIKHIPLQMHKI